MALISFSESLKNTLRRSDVIARVGGDEFVLLLVDVSDEDYIHKIIEQINTQYSLLKPTSYNVKLTFSAGYAIYPKDAPDLNQLISLANKKCIK